MKPLEIKCCGVDSSVAKLYSKMLDENSFSHEEYMGIILKILDMSL